MIIVDTALKKRAEEGNPVRVGMIGCGFMGRGMVNQIINSVPGMHLAAISNRTVDRAREAVVDAGAPEPTTVSTLSGINEVVAQGGCAITDDPFLLCEADGIDALIEVTGAVEFGAHVTMRAIDHGKHMVLLNAELDGTVGPVLKTYADKAGVVLSGSDGDQPGVEVNLYRFVQSIGLTPLVCGNIKGLHDPYRNPTTQEGFAKKWGQNPYMVTSFADGTKISFEQAIVANATGMSVAKRGMIGQEHEGHVDELTTKFDVDELRAKGGIVDYVVKTKPGPGVFILATHDDPRQQHYLNLYKLGPGPLYSFYTPYHLCHFEAPLSLARAVLFRDAVFQPIAGIKVEVVATAKKDLKAGEIVDDLGGYACYGLAENREVAASENLLPIGVSEGCKLKRDIVKDAVLTYDDVELPEGRLIDKLRAEQVKMFE